MGINTIKNNAINDQNHTNWACERRLKMNVMAMVIIVNCFEYQLRLFSVGNFLLAKAMGN